MSEPTKPRFTVDLEEMDRQLRRSAAPSAASRPAEPVRSPEPIAVQPAASATQNDPLAELARIVGQEDPFQSILAQPIVPQRGSRQPDPYAAAPRQPAYAPIPPARSPEVDALAELLRSDPGSGTAAFDPALSATNPNYPSYVRQGRAYEEPTNETNQFQAMREDHGYYAAQPEAGYAQAQQAPHQGGYDNLNPSYDDPKLGYSPGYASVDENYRGSSAPKSRKKLYGGVAACLLGVVAAYSFMRSGGISGNGEAPLVTASTEPTKVPPEAPGGKEFPDQNKQIYERNSIEGKTQIVNREEQPVDVQQAARGIAGSSGRSDYGEPRKIRTVAVGPDGTVIGGEAAHPAPRASAEPAATRPASTGASPNARAVQSTPALATEAPSATTTPAEPAAQPIAAPAPPRRPAALVATTSEAAQPAATTQAATAPTSAGGGFVVQFGVSGNEAEGVARFRKLQNQHPDLMADVGGSVRPAEVNGKTIFRIRSIPMSKEASDTLCSKLKAAGTECYVARN